MPKKAKQAEITIAKHAWIESYKWDKTYNNGQFDKLGIARVMPTSCLPCKENMRSLGASKDVKEEDLRRTAHREFADTHSAPGSYKPEDPNYAILLHPILYKPSRAKWMKNNNALKSQLPPNVFKLGEEFYEDEDEEDGNKRIESLLKTTFDVQPSKDSPKTHVSLPGYLFFGVVRGEHRTNGAPILWKKFKTPAHERQHFAEVFTFGYWETLDVSTRRAAANYDNLKVPQREYDMTNYVQSLFKNGKIDSWQWSGWPSTYSHVTAETGLTQQAAIQDLIKIAIRPELFEAVYSSMRSTVWLGLIKEITCLKPLHEKRAGDLLYPLVTASTTFFLVFEKLINIYVSGEKNEKDRQMKGEALEMWRSELRTSVLETFLAFFRRTPIPLHFLHAGSVAVEEETPYGEGLDAANIAAASAIKVSTPSPVPTTIEDHQMEEVEPGSASLKEKEGAATRGARHDFVNYKYSALAYLYGIGFAIQNDAKTQKKGVLGPDLHEILKELIGIIDDPDHSEISKELEEALHSPWFRIPPIYKSMRTSDTIDEDFDDVESNSFTLSLHPVSSRGGTVPSIMKSIDDIFPTFRATILDPICHVIFACFAHADTRRSWYAQKGNGIRLANRVDKPFDDDKAKAFKASIIRAPPPPSDSIAHPKNKPTAAARAETRALNPTYPTTFFDKVEGVTLRNGLGSLGMDGKILKDLFDKLQAALSNARLRALLLKHYPKGAQSSESKKPVSDGDKRETGPINFGFIPEIWNSPILADLKAFLISSKFPSTIVFGPELFDPSPAVHTVVEDVDAPTKTKKSTEPKVIKDEEKARILKTLSGDSEAMKGITYVANLFTGLNIDRITQNGRQILMSGIYDATVKALQTSRQDEKPPLVALRAQSVAWTSEINATKDPLR
ncbi:hypothetical protein JCM5353_001791, partial [Sporobolomyces roseus]